MINWEITGKAFWARTSAKNWQSANSDISEMLGHALTECFATHGFVLYIEMWPSSGTLICYPAIPPKDGNLSERVCEFVAQLQFPFWENAWLEISLNSANAELRYSKLKGEVLNELMQAFGKCVLCNPEWKDVELYAFEFEGSEGVVLITTNGMRGI